MIFLFTEMKSSSVLVFQAWCWARPRSLLLWWAPLSWRMWPLWLQLPWSSAARPRAALLSTLLLVSPVPQDPSTTTVSQWPCHLTWSHHFTCPVLLKGKPLRFFTAAIKTVRMANKIKVKKWFSVPPQAPCCVHAVLTPGCVYFLEPACRAPEVSISH